MQTSADFRAHNQILSTRRILHDNNGTGQDFIDLNNNGTADHHGHGRSVMVSYDEPALSAPLDNVESFGSRRGQEVVTQDEVGGRLKAVWMSRDTYEDGPRCWQAGGNESLDKFAAQCEPLEEGVRWAVDTKTQEFVLYKPGSPA